MRPGQIIGMLGAAARVLDFAALTPTQLQSRFGWVRTGAGTMEESDEDVVYWAHNVIRWSSDIAQSLWDKRQCTVDGYCPDPNGGNTAQTLVAVGAFPYLLAYASATTPATSGIWLRLRSGSGAAVVVGTDNTFSRPVTITSSWQQFSSVVASGFSIVANGFSFSAASMIDVWRPQVCVGSFLTDYVPTTTAPVYLMRSPDYSFGVPGLLLEGARTQLLGSGNIGAQLVTQTKTVTAVAHTLSFFGTGTVTLTGAHSATVVGTGATILRTFTFTPSAGSLTLTVTGTVTDGQLEAGSYATSRIPNATTGTLLRAADVAEIGPGAEFDELFPAAQGTLVVEWVDLGATEGDMLALHSNGTTNELVSLYYSGSSIVTLCRAGSANQLAVTIGARIPYALNKAAISWGPAGLSAVLNGGTVQSNGSATIPAPTHARWAGAGLASGAQAAWKPTKRTVLPTQTTGAALQALTA